MNFRFLNYLDRVPSREISVRFFENKAQTSEAILASDFCKIVIFDISSISNSGLAI